MDRERLRIIRELFEEARPLGRHERADFLAARCGDDAALRHEVASLLEADEPDVGVLERLSERIGSIAELLDEPPPEQVGPYEVLEEAGRGGMGVVYRAHDRRLRRDVALKFLPRFLGADAAARARFIEEARAASALDHQAICTIHDIGSADDGRLYIAMAWYGGGTLADRMRDGPLPADEAVRIASAVADALDRAHRAGIVHRDVKPANIAFSESGAPKVLDFGVAALETDPVAGPAGTPRYMAPEQLRGGAVDRRADIWALAVVLHEMLTGHPVYDAEDRATVLDQITRPDPRALDWSGVPPALNPVLARALSVDPSARHATAAEFADALRRALAAARPARSRRIAAAAAGAALLALAAVSIVLRGSDRTPEAAPDAAAVAVLPFRVNGDPSLDYLRDGMVDLLAAKLTGEGGLRAADPRTVFNAWSGMGVGADPDADSARALARSIGAGNVLLGDIVGTPEHIVVNTTMLDVSGQVVGRASVQGAAASLTELVDALAAQLLSARAGEAPQRLAVLTTTSLPALRAFLDGQAAYRRGRYEDALRHYARALEHDTTFALAGLGLELAGGWIGGVEQTRALGRDIAWRYRERLSAADRALLAAAIGPAHPRRSTTLETIAAIEEGLRIASDRVELWYMHADAYLHHGRVLDVADWEDRAEAGFRRALELDPSFAPPAHHLILLYARTRQFERMDAIAAEQLARVPAGATADFIRWLRSAARRERTPVSSRLDSLTVETLGWMTMLAQDDGYDQEFGRRAAIERTRRAATAPERFERTLALHAIALNAGRPQEALAFTDQLRDVQPDPDYYLRLRIVDALYADGDSPAAARAADELRSRIAASQTAADSVVQRMNRCTVEQWMITHGADTVMKPPRLVDPEASAALAVCEAAADALREVVRSRSAGPATERFDSLLVAGPFDLPVGDGSIEYANAALARVREIANEPDRALRAIRRRLYFLGWQAGTAASLHIEARLALQTGDRRGALRAAEHYVALRRDPEPALRGELAKVRRIGEQLLRD